MEIRTPWIRISLKLHYHSMDIYIVYWCPDSGYDSHPTKQSKLKSLVAFLLGGRYSGFENVYTFWDRDARIAFDSLFRLDSQGLPLDHDDDDIPF